MTDGTQRWHDVQRVLFVHAHPDDETLSTGALIVELVARGIRVDVVTCTRGERGEIVPGPLSHLAGSPDFPAHRERELAGAIAVLGVTGHAFLGTPPACAAGRDPHRYADSGMRWIREGLAGPDRDVSPDAFTQQSDAEQVDDLLAYLDDAGRPDLIVSYDETGGYGHPDHVRAREVAEQAASRAGIRFAEVVAERSALPDPDRQWIDLQQNLPTVIEALRHHASQVTVDGADVIHSGGQRTPIQTSVGLREL